MMLKKQMVFIVMLMMCGNPCADAKDPIPEPAMDDFAYGIALNIDGSGAICSIELPEDVYKNAFRSDLGDIRVFNGQKEIVPHAIQGPDPEGFIRKPPAEIPFFPLYLEMTHLPKTKQKGVVLNINTDEKGTIIDVRADGLDSKDKRIQAYLFDLSQFSDPLEAIELQWSGPDENFHVDVSMSASADLNAWHTVVARQSLVDLDFSGHRLVKNKIVLPVSTRKYHHMTWPAETGDFVLTGAKAIFFQKATDYPRHWISVTGKKSKNNGDAYEFDTGGMFPVDQVGIELPQQNSLIQGILQSRTNPNVPWTDRYQGLFYRLSVGDEEITPDPAVLQPIPDRYWRLVLTSEGAGLGAGAPGFKFSWQKYRLLFLLRGNPPFILAYGAASVSLPKHSLAELFPKIRQTGGLELVQAAVAGNPFSLGGPERLKPLAPALPWKKWLLWGILVLSVVLLAAMAVHLFQQMNA